MISLLYRGLSKGFFPKDLGSYNYGLFRNILKDIYKDFIKIISKELSKLPSFFFYTLNHIVVVHWFVT